MHCVWYDQIFLIGAFCYQEAPKRLKLPDIFNNSRINYQQEVQRIVSIATSGTTKQMN